MNAKWIRAMVGLAGLGLLAAPVSAQRVRVGVDARLSDRAVASVRVGDPGGLRVAVRYGYYGPRHDSRSDFRSRRAWARHQRERRALDREHERLHRRMRELPPRARARAHRDWLERALYRHGHSHPEWEHGNGRWWGERPVGLRPLNHEH